MIQKPPREVKALLRLGSAATIQITCRESRTDSGGRPTRLQEQFQEYIDAREPVSIKRTSKLDARPPEERWGINE
jgi:hypothetical protein